MITLGDALRQMEASKKAFQLKFVTCNLSKNTGGELIELTAAFKTGAKYNMKRNDLITVRQENSADHPYPVHIHLITELNHKKVII
ncbi:MAG: hypothetical protein A3F72_02945 [Bacteroidetes bacterium RIFCSPLOWO2_12_FULL_35_15]|nr:MAG: hypothetical protein A3F72_02945 [Bacteroidetes bacterium RIFCSPLOWO2_12_FULL_35_15]